MVVVLPVNAASTSTSTSPATSEQLEIFFFAGKQVLYIVFNVATFSSGCLSGGGCCNRLFVMVVVLPVNAASTSTSTSPATSEQLEIFFIAGKQVLYVVFNVATFSSGCLSGGGCCNRLLVMVVVLLVYAASTSTSTSPATSEQLEIFFVAGKHVLYVVFNVTTFGSSRCLSGCLSGGGCRGGLFVVVLVTSSLTTVAAATTSATGEQLCGVVLQVTTFSRCGAGEGYTDAASEVSPTSSGRCEGGCNTKGHSSKDDSGRVNHCES